MNGCECFPVISLICSQQGYHLLILTVPSYGVTCNWHLGRGGISHFPLSIFVQSHLYHVSFVNFRLHQLLLGLLDFLGLLGSDISEGLSTLCLIPLSLSRLLLFQLPEELLVVFVLQPLESLSFVLSLVYLFLSSLVLHLKHSVSISEELDIIFNPNKNAIKFKT